MHPDLEGTESYKLANTTRQTAQQGCNRKQAKTDLKNTAPPETVRHGASEHEEARDYEGVCVEDPLESRDGGVEIVLNNRQGNVNNRDVHAEDQHAHAAYA